MRGIFERTVFGPTGALRRLHAPYATRSRGGRDRVSYFKTRPDPVSFGVESGDAVPPGYRRFPVKSPAIYAKVQVLSSKFAVPVFIETPSVHSEQRIAYWVHEDVLPELARWLRVRIFPISDIVDPDA